MLQWGGIGIGDWDVAGLHGNEFLVGFEVVIFWEDSCTDELFLKDGDEVEEILWGIVAYIIYIIRWNWQSVFALVLLWGVLHHSYYAFHDVIDIGEVTLAVAVIENLDGFTFHQFVGETEVCHVRATSWTINGEETETCRWDVIEFAIGMRHQLVALLCCGVERYGVVHFIVCGVWHFFVAAIN